MGMESNSSASAVEDGRHRKYFSRCTIFGPLPLLPDRLKRFNAVTDQEFQQYDAKVDETQGFDVDGCHGTLPERIVPIRPDTINWEPAEITTQFAVSKKDHGKSVEYKQLVKANIQPVEGMLYYLTFTGVDLADHIEKLYRAKVQAKPGPHLCLISFEEVPNNHEKAKEMREELAPMLAKIAKKRSKMAPEPQPKVDYKHVINIEMTRKERLTKSFYCLVKEMHRQNPSWKYGRVKKAASKKWKSLLSYQKNPYLRRAGEDFGDKLMVMAEHIFDACKRSAAEKTG